MKKGGAGKQALEQQASAGQPPAKVENSRFKISPIHGIKV